VDVGHHRRVEVGHGDAEAHLIAVESERGRPEPVRVTRTTLSGRSADLLATAQLREQHGTALLVATGMVALVPATVAVTGRDGAAHAEQQQARGAQQGDETSRHGVSPVLELS
jgi:hypothetical protein